MQMKRCFIWDNDYDEEKRINSYALTLFVQEEDNRYERFDEYHEQRAFSIDEVRCAIEESGMIFLSAIDKMVHLQRKIPIVCT